MVRVHLQKSVIVFILQIRFSYINIARMRSYVNGLEVNFSFSVSHFALYTTKCFYNLQDVLTCLSQLDVGLCSMM